MDKSALEGRVQPLRFKEAALLICGKGPEEVMKVYPLVHRDSAPFLCLDLCFISSLLEFGFGVGDKSTLLMAQKLVFRGEHVETQWPLGASLEELGEELAKLDAQGVL